MSGGYILGTFPQFKNAAGDLLWASIGGAIPLSLFSVNHRRLGVPLMTAETIPATSSKCASFKRHAAYALAAGASGCVATNGAHAAVVYSGTQDLNISQFSSTNLDINGDLQGDVRLENYVFGGSPYQGATVNFAPGNLVGFTSGNSYVTARRPGESY